MTKRALAGPHLKRHTVWRSLFSPLSICVLSLILVACGEGGSSSAATTPSAPLVPTDAAPPTLALDGFETVEVVVGGLFIDPGATALDDQDGDISGSVVVTSSLNTQMVGTYTLAYDVSDAAGNAAAQVVRSVTVVAGGDKQHYGANAHVHIKGGLSGFPDIIDSGDRFARDHDIAGDIDGDGILDLVVGARSDDDGAVDAGAVYIIFLKADGTVKNHQKISQLEGGLVGPLAAGDFFGYGVAGIGDYDGDSIPDIAVTAPFQAPETLYVLHLNRDGTVKSQVENTGIPGQALSAAGDINGDGRIDLIAGDPAAAGGGAVEILFLNATSRVVADETIVISSIEGGFGTGLAAGDDFGGRESAVLGDLDGDGNIEIAVGAFQSDAGLGAIWIVTLETGSLTVLDKVKITSGQAGFDEVISADENPNGSFGGQFGHAMAAVGDLNGDGIPDLFTGANQNQEGYAFILYLNADKTIKTYTRINAAEGGFDLDLDPTGRFSRSISSAGDVNDDGIMVVNVGGDADGTGGFYALKYQRCNFAFQGVDTFWSDGTSLFSNWSHTDQIVTGPLSFEQCAAKAFEVDGDRLTFSGVDRRCIIQDSFGVLTQSTEGSIAYLRQCD